MDNDSASMTFTSLALIVLLAILLIMFACHFLGPRATTWMRSNKEEKIGLSKNTLFHANGYMIHSGSEFLLSNSGSFKRFDTIDKDDYKQSGQNPAQQSTTPLWNLPQTESSIPPQPLRPAPAPAQAAGSANHVKTVTFSFNKLDETMPNSEHRITVESQFNATHTNAGCTINDGTGAGAGSGAGTLVSCMRSSTKAAAPIPQAIEAPPPPRLSSSSSVALCSTAIPRPITKRQISLQNVVGRNGVQEIPMPAENLTGRYNDAAESSINTSELPSAAIVCKPHSKTLTRRNSSTNPFLCETTESLNEPNTALQPSNSNSIQPHSSTTSLSSSITTPTAPATLITNPNNSNISNKNASNPFHEETNETDKIPVAPSPKKALLQNQPFRNRSFSETEASESDLNKFSANMLKLAQNTTNPFTSLKQKVKGPHMLQKTISEDYLFRKLGKSYLGQGQHTASTTNTNAGNAGNGTWSFGRSFLRHDSIISLGRRNGSQCSLDSTGGSMEGINLERAISCDSVNSDSSLFQYELDQPYTQITGYLCVGLQYDKNTITEEGMELIVSVLEAKGLICPFSVESLDTFVRIYLVPDQAGAMQTKVFASSQTPSYNESFTFWLKKQRGRHSLWFHLYHNGVAHTLLGEAEMEIGEMPRPITTWIPISDSRKCNAQWGELMFSLSYLPTAERLTIVVVKARNLKLGLRAASKKLSPQEAQNIFVKVYLLNNEKKVLKKRTSLKRKDRFPIFNESMIFSVPPQSLTTVQLRLTVFGVIDSNEGPTITPLGHVIAGSCATGKGLRHWHQMLSSLRKPVAMWHVLRRATNQPVFTGGAEAVVAAMQSTTLRAHTKRNSII